MTRQPILARRPGTASMLAAGTFACLMMAGAGKAAECGQERAIYTDDAGIYELAFAPVDNEAAAISHAFSIKVLGTALVLSGHVMASEPLNRPMGTVLNNCPDGDVTGADIAACTVWEGVVYGQSAGRITPLPPEGAAAAEALLLPDFGSSLRLSSAWGADKATFAPWDVFTFKGCAP